jgi:hypothetical protein
MEDVKTTLNGVEYVIPKGDIVITSPAVSMRLDHFKNANMYHNNRHNHTPYTPYTD